MKKIKTFAHISVHLEGYGFVEFQESIGGEWRLHLNPTGTENQKENLLIGTPMEGGGLYFTTQDNAFIKR